MAKHIRQSKITQQAHLTFDELGSLRESRAKERDRLIDAMKQAAQAAFHDRLDEIVELVIGRPLDVELDDDTVWYSHWTMVYMKILNEMASEAFYPAISFSNEWIGVTK